MSRHLNQLLKSGVLQLQSGFLQRAGQTTPKAKQGEDSSCATVESGRLGPPRIQLIQPVARHPTLFSVAIRAEASQARAEKQNVTRGLKREEFSNIQRPSAPLRPLRPRRAPLLPQPVPCRWVRRHGDALCLVGDPRLLLRVLCLCV